MVWRLFSIHRNFEPDAALAAIEAEQLSAGNPLPAGATGEICLRGPKVTKGYWKDPERTASAFFG